jgi:hypothetical protein
LTGASSAPAPWTGNPQTRTIPISQATGTVNYYLRIPVSAAGGAFPQSSGWSTNNNSSLGNFWATITWRNVGDQVIDVPAVACTVSYTA